MEKDRGVVIIGADNIGKTCAIELSKRNNICDLHNVVDSQFTEPPEPKPFLITRMPELTDIWIDPKEPKYNYHKQQLTFDKNRKARKKRKRR